MKNNFYRPNNVDFNEFGKIIRDLKESFAELSSGNYKTDDLQDFVIKIIEDQDNDGFWGLINPNKVPSEARIDYFYMPTYYSTAILIKFLLDYPDKANEINDFRVCLEKGLKASAGRGLKGHGYDEISGVVEAMKIFCSAGLAQFIKQYPDLCPEFTIMITAIVDFVKKSLEEGNTRGAWDEDYNQGFTFIQDQFPEEK